MNQTWQAFVADNYGHVFTDPDEIAEKLATGDGQVSIRRGSALPTEIDGGLRLPGSCRTADLFMEVDLDDIEEDEAAEFWELAQAAAAGMSKLKATVTA